MVSTPNMTRSADSQDSENNFQTSLQCRKRIRSNHNELERVRRVNQKAQLDALRVALPFQDMDEKASMVSIFVRAREYIQMLEQRIMELQDGNNGNNINVSASLEAPGVTSSSLYNLLGTGTATEQPSSPSSRSNYSTTANNNVTLPVPPILQSPPVLTSSQPAIPTSPRAFAYSRERELSVNPEHVQLHHGVPFYNANLVNIVKNPSSNNIEVPNLVTPDSSPVSKPHEPSLNADILRSFISENYLKRADSQICSSDEEANFRKIFQERRGSSLLMPFEDETVMFQKRDSLSALFSGLLPDFVDMNALSGSDINCHKCKKGMCNMIMIDCDKCHKWYHIKCANIESDSIPTVWKCC